MNKIVTTEFAFTLPRGYVDPAGNVHREGVMRLATAMDEVAPLADPRSEANIGYLSILLLSRVVVSLGSIRSITSEVIQGLFASDFAYLQEMYLRLNESGFHQVETECPSCGTRFELNLLNS